MDHLISLEQAVQMTTTFRENKDKILQDGYQGKDLIANAETFDRAAFDKLLAQPGCEQVRIYYGMDEALKVHAIIVGVDAAGNDLLAPSDSPSGQEPIILDIATRCPPDCPVSVLNP